MSFVDVEMFFFLPVVLALYWVMPRVRVAQNVVLLLAGWVFYFTWNWRLLPLLVFGGLLDYLVGRYLESGTQGTAPSTSRRRAALAISLTWNLGALAYFKYVGFFAQSFNELMGLLGLGSSLPVLHVLLPLGISFYTLQRLGYVIDVYYGRLPACRSPLDFMVFTTFFPQLTAGPIARGGELLPQLAAPRRLTADIVARGAGAFLLGYVLKGWVADSLGDQIVDPVFGAAASYDTVSHWLGIFGYALQVFADFAGYSLLAIGTARLFGIELPTNFDNPFLSRSLPEFWRRWHITLNRWLFDYIYNPLVAGNGWFRGRFYAALMLVFLASGLWHGAAMTFIVWGLLHGIGMVVHRAWDEFYRGLCRKDRKYVGLRKSTGYALASWFLTQAYFVFSLIPFRSRSFTEALHFSANLAGSGGSARIAPGLLAGANLALCAGVVVLLHVLAIPGPSRLRDGFFRLPAPVRGMAYGLVIVYLFLYVPVGAGNFIYQQF
jgi:alginate O-acetyltransferase complex protein AlgI